MSRKIEKLSFYREPQDIFAKYQAEEMAVFLDSSLENEMGRYSVIAVSPRMILSETDGVCMCNGSKQKVDILTLLQEELDKLEKEYENPYELPLTTGAIGYFSYEFGRKVLGVKSRHVKKDNIPDALFCFYDVYIIADVKEKQLYLSVEEGEKEKSGGLQAWIKKLEQIVSCPPIKKHTQLAEAQHMFTRETYGQALQDMITYMKDGHIYVANMTQQFHVKGKLAPFEVYRYLRTYNPAPFSAYLNYGTFQVACASPERFLRKEKKRITTRPIKGTRKRGETIEQDQILRAELEQSEKDRSELLMIMDLERNDLNRICVPGSVKVTEPFVIEEYATVFHLVSEIQGKVRPDLQLKDFVRSLFPGGSITGAPKIRAMEIIDELEKESRGLYTGNIGYFAGDGSCDFNIVIRTAIYEEKNYHIGAGGGITYESDVAFEYEETLQKAKALLEAIYEKD